MTRALNRKTRMTIKTAAVAGLMLAASAGAALAQAPGAFPEQSGKEIYAVICQACHMPDGKGSGAISSAPIGYPALANNLKLAAPAYPALVVVRGLRAMPGFGNTLSDGTPWRMAGSRSRRWTRPTASPWATRCWAAWAAMPRP